jgi:pantoate--beta-alanine ligase
MRIEGTVAGLRELVRTARAQGSGPVGLVATMGALHAGHGALLRQAREECGWVVATLFVNPAQFAPGEDLALYPRDPEGDAAFAERAGADVLFAPETSEVYPPGFDTRVEVEGLASVLDGHPARRGPGHFQGVATVVLKLLNIAGADVTYFGQKDLQQAILVRRMVHDLDVPVRVRVVPTVRAPDGLALSSRNRYLSASERERALALSRGLSAAEHLVLAGDRDAERVVAAVREELERAGLQPEYVELRRLDDLTSASRADDGTAIAVAVRVGRARLIDNVVFGPLDVLSDPPPVLQEEIAL